MTFKSRDQHFNINFLHIMATSIQILTFNHDCMRMLRNCEHRSISLIVKDCDYCHKEVEGGHLYSEKDVPNFETSSSILQSYFPEFTAEIIQRSQTMHNMSLSNRLSIYKVREFSKESATSIYVMENYYEASLSQFRAISSLQLSSSYNHDLSTIEDILGRVLHKLSGMTETKKADLKSMMEWMDKITITQFMDRSVVLNTTNLDHYSNSEYLHLLPYYCFLKRLNTIMRYDSFLKTFNSLYPYEKIPPGDLGVICRYLTSTAIRRIKFEHDLLLYYNSNSPLSSARNYFRIFLACRIMYIIYRNPFRNLTIDGPNFPSYYDYLSTRYFNTDMYTLNYLHFLIYMYFVLPDKLELLAAVTNQEMEYEQSVTLTIRDLLTNLDDIPSEYDKIDNMEPTSRFCFTMVKHHCSALRSVEFWTDPFDEELSEDFIQSINDLIELTIKTNTLTLTGYDLPDIINEIRRSSRPNPLKYIYLYPGPEKTPLNLNLQLYIPHQTITSTHLELDNSLLGLIPPKKPANKKLILSLWELYDTNKIFISPILNYIVCMLRKNNIPDISQAQVVIGNDNGGYLLSILWQFFINTSFIYFEETDHSQNEVILSMDPRLTSSDLISRRNNLFTETIQTGTSSLSNAISPSHLNKFFTFTQPDQLLFLFYPKTTISTLEHLETGLQKISGFLVSFLKTVAVMIVQVDHDDLNKFSTRLLPKLVSSSQNSDFLHPIYVCDKNIFTFVFLEFNPLLFQEQQITFLTIHSERIFSDRMERNLLSIEKITSLASFESECKYDDLEIIYLGRLIHYILPSLSDYYNIDLLPVNIRNLECLNYYNTIQDCFIAIRNFITGLLVSQLNQTSCVEYNIMKSKETIIPDSVEFTRHHSSSLHSDATWSSTTRKTLRDYYEKIVYLKSVIFGMNKHSLENTGHHDMEIENNNFYITLLSECNKNLFPNRRFLPIADAYQDEGFIFKPKSIMVSGVKNGLRIYYILELLYK
uniref:Uncharacterized protein n=1 Tax=Panonychus citri mivirus TaxID=2760845 RepID=A0A7G4YW60_9VIRU|nr:hypothetical protein [Panonychus citri mivirus]